MIPRKRPVKPKIIVAIIVDTLLFFILSLVVYTFFIVPVRAENIAVLEDTLELAGTCTPDPTPTNTPDPTPTNTPEPTPTNTPDPTPTNTPEPTPTTTPEPTPTNTPEPTSTNTPEPTSTNTPEPTSTNTPEPTSTNTSEPSASPTFTPTNTQTSTVEPSRTPSPTIIQPPDDDTPEPSRTPPLIITPRSGTKTPTPSPTAKLANPTLSAISTQIISICPSCYLVKDFRELIISGLYTADLLNTEDISSTINVSITLYNEYKGGVVGKAIGMVDTQPANEVMHVETPLWCIDPTAPTEYWIHTIASAQDNTGKIWFVLDEWVKVDLIVDLTKVP